MIIVKDIIIEIVRRMPENVTFKEVVFEILEVGKIYEDLKSSEGEGSITIDKLLAIRKIKKRRYEK